MTAIGHHGGLAAFRTTHAVSPRMGSVVPRHLVVVLATIALVMVTFAHPVAAPAVTAADAMSPQSTAAEEQRADAMARLRALEREVRSAQTAWEESADRVLDESPRATLQAEIAGAERVTQEVRTGIVWPGTTLEQALDANAVTIAEARAALTAGVTGVDEAVAAWEAEQARLAAEAEAARVAAEAAAAAAHSRGYAGAPHVAAAGAVGVHLETIWTSGGQAQIDACRGAVDVTPVASYLGAGFYAAEHWSCGGSAWGGIGAGALVDFAGYGTYRVAGRVGGLIYGSDASVLPGGYAGYYQTCVGGDSSNMTVWLLTRVG